MSGKIVKGSGLSFEGVSGLRLGLCRISAAQSPDLRQKCTGSYRYRHAPMSVSSLNFFQRHLSYRTVPLYAVQCVQVTFSNFVEFTPHLEPNLPS